LSGKHTVGIYPLFPDSTCHLLAVDFDKSDWQLAVKAFGNICDDHAIPYATERSRSGDGAHVWIFFDQKETALNARRLGFYLLDRAMEKYPEMPFDSCDRLFPNQDSLPTGGFGNLIALPLQYQARQYGNSIFLDDNPGDEPSPVEQQAAMTCTRGHKGTATRTFVRVADRTPSTHQIAGCKRSGR
jgi:hypothetical protein